MNITNTHKEKSEFQKNRETLKSCKIFDQLAIVFYLSSTFGIALYSFFHIFLFGIEGIVLLLFGVVAYIGVFLSGYWGIYKKKVLLSSIPAVISLISGLVCSAINTTCSEFMRSMGVGTLGGLGIFMAVVYTILMILNMLNIDRFNHIKEQPGYPYFNDLIEKQKEERRQFEIKSEYEKTYERLTNNKVEKVGENLYKYSTNTTKSTQIDEI